MRWACVPAHSWFWEAASDSSSTTAEAGDELPPLEVGSDGFMAERRPKLSASASAQFCFSASCARVTNCSMSCSSIALKGRRAVEIKGMEIWIRDV